MHCLLSHSNYSFLQGSSSPKELIDAAFACGLDGLALTDFDGAYGLVQGYLAARELAQRPLESPGASALPVPRDASAFRFFYGAEVLLTRLSEPHVPSRLTPRGQETDAPLLADTPVFLQERLAFLATSKESYAQICALLTYAHRDGKRASAISPFDDEAPWPTDALVIKPQRGLSLTLTAATPTELAAWLEDIEKVKSRFGENFFLALTPPTSPFELNSFANHLVAHRRLGVPLIATGDAFFHDKARKSLHDMMTAIRLRLHVDDASFACFANAERTLHAPSYYRRMLLGLPEWGGALENNLAQARRIDFSFAELKYQYPQEFIPEGQTSIEYLKTLVRAACQARYGASPRLWPVRMVELVRKELVLVEELGFADYFLTVFDIVRFARQEGILCQGRGSAANSAVCFLLGVTPVDPMISEVLFERFISRERGEPPDIDVDFEHERREEVIQYIYARYGRHRAAMVANVVTFRSKGAYRGTGTALGLADDFISAVSFEKRNLAEKATPAAALSSVQGFLAEAPQRVFSLSGRWVTSHADLLSVWFEHAALLRGMPHHLGIHSGGFVVSHTPLHFICPVEPATMDNRSIIQWNKDDLEALGLFKIDVLALGMLTALRKTFVYLREARKHVPGTLVPVALDTIDTQCQKTFDLMCAAQTTGTFQVESRAQMSMLPRLRPRCFYDVVIQVAIVRPGPIVGQLVHPYLARRDGREKVFYPHPALKPILERTLGVSLFQEQVMRIAIAVGNFTGGEADQLRKSIGSWSMKGGLGPLELKLKEGMRAHGITEEYIENLFKQIESFAHYGFPESHATSFAYLAYASCYVKAHFPAYFLCGLLNSQPLGFYSAHSLLQEGRHAGLKVKAPCLLDSDWDSVVLQDGTLQLGFRLLAGLREAHVRAFVPRRQALVERHRACAQALPHPPLNEMFSILPFCARERMSLVLTNCFRKLNPHRVDVLWYLLALPADMFADVNEGSLFESQTAAFSEAADVKDDFKHMGTSLGAHPMTLIKRLGWAWSAPLVSLTMAARLDQAPNRSRVTVAGIVILRQMPPTAKGMLFVTLEDETGVINLIVRPDVLALHKEVLLTSSLLCVTGRKQSNGPQSTVVVESCLSMTRRAQKKQAEGFDDALYSVEEDANRRAKPQTQENEGEY